MKKPKFTKVKSLGHLKGLVKNKLGDFRISLNGGVFSRKYIKYNTNSKMFYIENRIDESTQYLGEKGIMDGGKTMIGKAILTGNLWLEEII